MKRIYIKNRLTPNPPNSKRVTRPSRWGNPFKVADYGRVGAIEKFKEHLGDNPELVEMAKRELTSFDLCCTCKPDEACHGDVWIEILTREKNRQALKTQAPLSRATLAGPVSERETCST